MMHMTRTEITRELAKMTEKLIIPYNDVRIYWKSVSVSIGKCRHEGDT